MCHGLVQGDGRGEMGPSALPTWGAAAADRRDWRLVRTEHRARVAADQVLRGGQGIVVVSCTGVTAPAALFEGITASKGFVGLLESCAARRRCGRQPPFT